MIRNDVGQCPKEQCYHMVGNRGGGRGGWAPPPPPPPPASPCGLSTLTLTWGEQVLGVLDFVDPLQTGYEDGGHQERNCRRGRQGFRK